MFHRNTPTAQARKNTPAKANCGEEYKHCKGKIFYEALGKALHKGLEKNCSNHWAPDSTDQQIAARNGTPAADLPK